MNEISNFILYTTPNGDVQLDILLQDENLWLTQKGLAELFGVERSVITKHLKNIYDSGELDKMSTCAKFAQVQQERTVTAYFDYIEGLVERRNTFTMRGLADSIDRFLSFNEYEILEGKGSVSEKQADSKAIQEYETFNRTQKIISDFDKHIMKIMRET